MATAQYGYLPTTYKPPKQKLAAAASKDPYGLAPNNRSGPLGIGSSSGFAAPPAAPRTPGYTQGQVDASLAANPHAAGTGGSLFAYQGGPAASEAAKTPTAAALTPYDINTDPALQQIQALVGRSSEGARAAALKQKSDLLLNFGDPTLAAAVLGSTDPLVAAAGQNPTSTVAQLGLQRDRNLHDLLEGLNQQNLAYSGYRIGQEQQAGQDYQNALAQAAAGVNQGLGDIDTNLLAALAANNDQLGAGINAAQDRAATMAQQTGTDPGAIDPQTLAAAAAADTAPPVVPPPTAPPGGEASGGGVTIDGGGLPVGATDDPLLYLKLGRKLDPRFNA